MQFDFYNLEPGEQGVTEFRLLKTARLQALPENAKEAVNSHFQQMVGSNPTIGSIFVVSTTIGEPPGVVVAAEEVHSVPVQIRERQNLPARRLIWVTDQSALK